jgi:hypothetical protein
MPRNNIFQTLTRQYNFAVELVAIWEISGLNVSRRPLALSETFHAGDAINTAETIIFIFKRYLFL